MELLVSCCSMITTTTTTSEVSCVLNLQQLPELKRNYDYYYVSMKKKKKGIIGKGKSFVLCCSNYSSLEPIVSVNAAVGPPQAAPSPPPLKKKRKRYRKKYPGESVGITEEMRFVAMRLRNISVKGHSNDDDDDDDSDDDDNDDKTQIDANDDDERQIIGDVHDSLIDEGNEDTINNHNHNGSLPSFNGDNAWKPTMEGFLKYLVDTNLVFHTIEQIVDQSNDVSYAYFRKTGLERSASLSKDLDWLRQQDFVIPDPSSPGITYATYLDKLSEKNAPLFLAHFYNIYFAHIAGGQVIARKVSEKLLDGRELEFCRWETDMEGSLKGVRDKMNLLGEHWSRDESNRCLIEASKAFKFLGQIIRLIIL